MLVYKEVCVFRHADVGVHPVAVLNTAFCMTYS